MQQELGAGNSAVYLVTRGAETLALKEVMVNTDHALAALQKEVRIHRSLALSPHPNLVAFLDYCIL